MVASNSYHKLESDRVKFPIEMVGWRQIDLSGKQINKPSFTSKSGLAYDICEKIGTREVIFALRGTDSFKDYLTANFGVGPLSGQYKESVREYDTYVASHPEKLITVIGHSLGGGLAAGISLRRGVNLVALDSSPRVFDGWGDRHVPAESRIFIYQKKEVLAQARAVWPKMLRTFPKEYFYETDYDFQGWSNHRADWLALGMVNDGAKVDSQLKKVADIVNQKVARKPVRV
jgi:pimeloyl-ACP methyl ester carboxylesterase